MSLLLKHLTPVIGAEVSDLDLARCAPVQIQELRRALAERLVLVFRNQVLTPDQHKNVALQFGVGPLHRHAFSAGAADPEILVVKTDESSKYTAGEGWHTDVSCDRAPIIASLLYLTELPENGGGDTLYANMYAAWEALSEPMRTTLEGLHAVHDGALPWKTVYGKDPEPGQKYARNSHPIALTHPETGRKLLWVNRGFTTHIEGLSRHESKHLLEMLFTHIESSPRIQCRVRWQPNTLVMWENLATQHHAVWDYYPSRRYAERVSVIGPALKAA